MKKRKYSKHVFKTIDIRFYKEEVYEFIQAVISGVDPTTDEYFDFLKKEGFKIRILDDKIIANE